MIGLRDSEEMVSRICDSSNGVRGWRDWRLLEVGEVERFCCHVCKRESAGVDTDCFMQLEEEVDGIAVRMVTGCSSSMDSLVSVCCLCGFS